MEVKIYSKSLTAKVEPQNWTMLLQTEVSLSSVKLDHYYSQSEGENTSGVDCTQYPSENSTLQNCISSV